MADWNHPVLSDSYSSILTTHLTGRDVDAITLCNTDPSNIPEHAIKYDRSTNKFRERVNGAWIDLNLSIAGGGTGGNTAATARAALGLGTLATQNDNAVAITGGTISGVTLPASVITSGTLPLVRGGLGSSLSIGAAGTFLRSNGTVLQFSNDGSSLTGVGSQTVRATTGTQYVLTTSYADVPGLSASITPRATSSRVRITASICCNINALATGSQGHVDVAIYRGATLVQEFACILFIVSGTVAGTTGAHGGSMNVDITDSPATTSGITYNIKARYQVLAGSISGAINPGGLGAVASSIILSEIV